MAKKVMNTNTPSLQNAVILRNDGDSVVLLYIPCRHKITVKAKAIGYTTGEIKTNACVKCKESISDPVHSANIKIAKQPIVKASNKDKYFKCNRRAAIEATKTKKNEEN